MKQVTVKLDTIDTVKKFVAVTSTQNCDMDLTGGRHTIDAKSIMGIFSLNLSLPLQLTLHCDDPEPVLKELAPFIVS